jgi:hypothetical protein
MHGEIPVAHRISCTPGAVEMLLSVNLDRNSRPEAGEIEHVRTARNLSAKMQTLLSQQTKL